MSLLITTSGSTTKCLARRGPIERLDRYSVRIRKRSCILDYLLAFRDAVLSARGAQAPTLANRDPLGEDGDLHLYRFCYNGPLTHYDPDGEDAVAIGPITIPIPGTTKWYEKPPQDAHERQHRQDWKNGMPGWKKEQRGFGAEADAWRKQIAAMNGMLATCPASRRPKLEEEIGDAEGSLGTAETIAHNPQAAIAYWNSAARRWWQPKATLPTLPPGYTPSPGNVNRNRFW